MLRVVSLDDEKGEVTDIEKLFPSESFSLTYSSSSSDDEESGITSLLKHFDYDDIESLPDDEPDDNMMPRPTDYLPLIDTENSIWGSGGGIGIIPLPEGDIEEEESEQEEESDDDSDSVVSDFTDDSSILTTSTSRFDDFVDDSDEPYSVCELLFDEFNGSVVPWKFQL